MFGFKAPKVASIVHAISGITAAIEELRIVEELEADKATDYANEAAIATTNAEVATHESERAGRIANTFETQIA